MANNFVVKHFLVRKWLLDFEVGEVRQMDVEVCRYVNMKSTISQMKRMGKGEWKISKKHMSSTYEVTRVK